MNSADLFSKIVKIETEQIVGKNVKSPAATRVVGGWAIMFLMFALNGAATSLFEERKAGIFHRLLAAPVTVVLAERDSPAQRRLAASTRFRELRRDARAVLSTRRS